MRLKVKPELCLHVEKAPEPEGSISGYGPPAVYYFIYSPWGYSDIFSKPILADSHRFQKFRQKDFAGMDWGKVAFCHIVTSLVVINDLDVTGIIALPYKTNAPLLVDPDTMLPLPVAAQRLQIIRRRNTQRFKDSCRVQDLQLYRRSSLNGLRQLCGELPVKELFSLLVFERLDHKEILSRRDIIVKGYYGGNAG